MKDISSLMIRKAEPNHQWPFCKICGCRHVSVPVPNTHALGLTGIEASATGVAAAHYALFCMVAWLYLLAHELADR